MEQSILDIFGLYPEPKSTTTELVIEGANFDLEVAPLNNLEMIMLDDIAKSEAERIFYAGLYGLKEDGEKITEKYKSNFDQVLELYRDRVPYAETRRLGELVLGLTNGSEEEADAEESQQSLINTY